MLRKSAMLNENILKSRYRKQVALFFIFKESCRVVQDSKNKQCVNTFRSFAPNNYSVGGSGRSRYRAGV